MATLYILFTLTEVYNKKRLQTNKLKQNKAHPKQLAQATMVRHALSLAI
jgi:hypothetical protein